MQIRSISDFVQMIQKMTLFMSLKLMLPLILLLIQRFKVRLSLGKLSF
jgi:hypothetical protein